MSLEINFKLKPVSLNHAQQSGRNGRPYKTKEYNLFSAKAQFQLMAYKPKISEFCKSLKDGETFKSSFDFIMPESKLFTKKGKISKISNDVDNLIKPINDIIFKLMKTFNADIDDSRVLECNSRKVLSKDTDYRIKFKLEKCEIIKEGA